MNSNNFYYPSWKLLMELENVLVQIAKNNNKKNDQKGKTKITLIINCCNPEYSLFGKQFEKTEKQSQQAYFKMRTSSPQLFLTSETANAFQFMLDSYSTHTHAYIYTYIHNKYIHLIHSEL